MTMTTSAPADGIHIVVVGGGTGSFTLLQALKDYTPHLTSLVNMADDGGSTGVLRDELGALPPGDIRQSLVALSRSPQVLRDLFNYRFEEGTLSGHAFGNLFLTALEKVTGNFAEAVETASTVLNITGKVLPITLDNVRLVLTIGDTRMQGEGNIDASTFAAQGERPNLALEPAATINPEARDAILRADLVVIAPGDLYTSLGPSLIVGGVAEALAQTPAKIAYVCNLVVKPGHTDGMSVADHAAEIERFAGGPFLDYVLYNTDHPEPAVLKTYAKEGELLVDARPDELAHYQAIGAPLLSHTAAPANGHDPLAQRRSLIRHDADATAKLLLQVAAHG